MKTKPIFVKLEKSLILLSIILLGTHSLVAQTWTPLAKTVSPYSSELYQYDNNTFGVHDLGIGINNTTPGARFHILTSGLVSKPLFKLEDPNLGSIKYFFTQNSHNYGMYQTGSDLYNYIEGPFVSGLTFYGSATSILAISNEPFPFAMQSSPSGPVYNPMNLYNHRLKIVDTLECNNFLMHNNPGAGRVLICEDRDGNGIWADPSGFDDGKWLVNRDDDMFANPNRIRVGIGFQDVSEKIHQRFHLVDGNILISKVHGGNPCSLNGSILFSDTVNESCPNGQWGIEYYNSGLNFWKVNCSQNSNDTRLDDDNYILFLCNNHNVGIGTNNTNGFKLAVNGNTYCDGLGVGTTNLYGYKVAIDGNVLCEELKVKKSENWPDYVFQDNYKLMPLEELEEFIKQNRHLPEIPTAAEVNQNGVNIGEMNVILVKKIEELSRYIIDQQKQIEDLRRKVENL